MGKSNIYLVGSGRAPKLVEVYHGKERCHALVRGQDMVTVPATYKYLLRGKNEAQFSSMPEEWQHARFEDLRRIPFDLVRLGLKLIKRGAEAGKISPRLLEIIPPAEIPSVDDLIRDGGTNLRNLGREAMKNDAFGRGTIAGGEAKRFGCDGPKALSKISDSSSAPTYLEVQAGDIRFAQDHYRLNSPLPWFLYVHPAHRETIEKYLKDNNYFRLAPQAIILAQNTAFVPKLTKDGKIAVDPTTDRIDFYNCGHGQMAVDFRRSPIFIEGGKLIMSPFEALRQFGVKYWFVSNIDNLGASVSDPEYPYILGNHIRSGSKMTIEVTDPIIAVDPVSGEKFAWDKGGIPFRNDDYPTVIDPPALRAETLDKIEQAAVPLSFNTANATLSIGAIPESVELPFSLVERGGLLQMEMSFWRLPDVNKSGSTSFIRVPREIPATFAQVPEVKDHPKGGRMVYPPVWRGPGNNPRNRFNPVKSPQDRTWSAGLYAVSTERGIDGFKTEKRILILDDDINLLNGIRDGLSLLGWKNVRTAATIEDAETLLKEGKFDFFLVDARLEKSRGIQFIRSIKQDPDNKALVLFWTAHKIDEIRSQLDDSIEATEFGRRGILAREKKEFNKDGIVDFEGLSSFIFTSLINGSF